MLQHEWFSFTDLWRPPTMLNWLEKAEAAAADAFDQVVADDTTLAMLAQGWRAYMAGQAGAPPAFRAEGNLVANAFDRGTVGESSLGEDYPNGLFDALRSSWGIASRGLALQNLAVPGGGAESLRLTELAGALEQATPPPMAPTPMRTEYESKFARLRRVLVDDTEGEPILLLASMINRWYILDFLPGGSFLAELASLGRPVYLLEWLAPRGADDTSLQTLVENAVGGAVDYVRKRHALEQISLAGYCMGGTLAAAYSARYPERVSRLMTICGPVDFEQGGAFRKWLGAEYLDVSLVASAFDTVPAELVHLPFWWLRPTIKWQKALRLARSFHKPGYIDRFMAAETWNHDNVDMGRGVFRSWAGDLYQNNALVEGRFVVEGEAVDLGRIECPTLIITGEHDLITPADGAEALANKVNDGEAQVLRLPSSHTGVLTNPKLLAQAREALQTWLERDTEEGELA